MEGEGERLGGCNKIYGTNKYKLIEKGQQCIFGGTNQLYYKETKKIFLENE